MTATSTPAAQPTAGARSARAWQPSASAARGARTAGDTDRGVAAPRAGAHPQPAARRPAPAHPPAMLAAARRRRDGREVARPAAPPAARRAGLADRPLPGRQHRRRRRQRLHAHARPRRPSTAPARTRRCAHDLDPPSTAPRSPPTPTGLPALRAERDRRARRRRHLRPAHRPGRQPHRRRTPSGCSPTTARSPDRPCGSGRARRSRCASATTATTRRPSTGTGCASTTRTTASPTRRRRRSPSAASSPTGSGSPTTASTGTTRTSARTTASRWACTATSSSTPPTPPPGRPSNREAVVTLDDVLIEDGRIAPFRIDGPTHTAMGRFGNVMLTAGTTDLTPRGRSRRGRPVLPHQHRQHPHLQRRRSPAPA